MDRIGLAWAAGLYEGEGTVGCYIQNKEKWNRSPQCSIKLAIIMTDPDILTEFSDVVNIGSVRGPFKGNGFGKKDLYRYNLSTFEHVQYVIAMLWPHLSVRRRQQYRNAVDKYFAFKRG